MVEYVKVRTWFQTFNNPYIPSCSISCCFQSAVLDFTYSAPLNSAKLGLWKSRTDFMMQVSAKYLFFYWCLELLLVAQIWKLSSQVSQSVSRHWGHVYILTACFAAQLCWREGDYLVSFTARFGCSYSAPQRAVFFHPLGVSAAPLMFDQPQKTAKRPVYPTCFQSTGQTPDSHRYHSGTGKVWLFSVWVLAKMCVSALFPSASRLMLQLNILSLVKKNQREFAF